MRDEVTLLVSFLSFRWLSLGFCKRESHSRLLSPVNKQFTMQRHTLFMGAEIRKGYLSIKREAICESTCKTHTWIALRRKKSIRSTYMIGVQIEKCLHWGTSSVHETAETWTRRRRQNLNLSACLLLELADQISSASIQRRRTMLIPVQMRNLSTSMSKHIDRWFAYKHISILIDEKDIRVSEIQGQWWVRMGQKCSAHITINSEFSFQTIGLKNARENICMVLAQ